MNSLLIMEQTDIFQEIKKNEPYRNGLGELLPWEEEEKDE